MTIDRREPVRRARQAAAIGGDTRARRPFCMGGEGQSDQCGEGDRGCDDEDGVSESVAILRGSSARLPVPELATRTRTARPTAAPIAVLVEAMPEATPCSASTPLSGRR
jgi:hypothetical protein